MGSLTLFQYTRICLLAYLLAACACTSESESPPPDEDAGDAGDEDAGGDAGEEDASGGQETDDVGAIMDVIDRYLEAGVNNDAAGMIALLSPDYSDPYGDDYAAKIDGINANCEQWPQSFNNLFDRIDWEKSSVKIYPDEATAIVVDNWSYEASPRNPDTPSTNTLQINQEYRLKKGSDRVWLISSIYYSDCLMVTTRLHTAAGDAVPVLATAYTDGCLIGNSTKTSLTGTVRDTAGRQVPLAIYEDADEPLIYYAIFEAPSALGETSLQVSATTAEGKSYALTHVYQVVE